MARGRAARPAPARRRRARSRPCARPSVGAREHQSSSPRAATSALEARRAGPARASVSSARMRGASCSSSRSACTSSLLASTSPSGSTKIVCAALRAVVNDAAHAAARLGPHRQHVAAVAHGDEPVGEERGRPRRASMRSRSATIRRRRSRICWRSWRSRGLARSVRLPSSSSAWRSASRRSVRRGQPVGERRHGGRDRADGPAPGLHAGPGVERGNQQHQLGAVQRAALGSARRGRAPAGRRGCRRRAAGPRRRGPGGPHRSARSRPATAATSTSGAASRACSRPMAVRASPARRDRTESHSVPRSTIRPAATRGLASAPAPGERKFRSQECCCWG